MPDQKPDTPKGTAVAKVAPPAADALEQKLMTMAKTPEERAMAFAAATRIRQSRMVREAAVAISALSWGRELTDYARGAIARYALETGTDPVRHWEVLGGHLYDTAELWQDLATSQADYNGYEADDLTWTDGLGDEEKMRRRAERARFGLPQDVRGACVVRIYRKGIERPFIGANHAGNRVGYNAKLKAGEHREAGDRIPDPIGEQDPGKTAFTRAFRRAAKTAWPLWPYKRLPGGDEGITVQELPPGTADRLAGREKVEGVIAQSQSPVPEPEPVQPVAAPTDPYAGQDDEARVRQEDARLAQEGR